MAEKGVVPSGSVPVDSAPDKDTAPDTKPEAKETPKETKPDKVYAGKYKSPEELEKSYVELQKKLGEQGNKVSALESQNKQLFDHVTRVQQAAQAQAAKQPEGSPTQDALNATMAELSKVDFMEDNAPAQVAQLMQKSIALTAQLASENAKRDAEQSTQQLLSKKDEESMTNQFLEKHPDFKELQEQGAFQALKSKNPMHDDFSAYYALKAQQAAEQATVFQAELEKAKEIANLAGGDAATSKVITKPGATPSGERPKPKSRAERRQSALDAVLRAGGG